MALPRAVQEQLDQAAAIEAQMSGGSESQTDPVAVEEPPPEVVPQAPVQENAPEWEQKYRTLQAKYNGEVPQYAAEVRELKHNVAQLSQALEAQKAAPPPQPAKQDSLVSEKDKEVFGEDLVNLQERIARAATAPLEATIQKLSEQLRKYEGTAESAATQQAATAEERYFERLQGREPEFAAINTDPKWLEWLGGRYPGASMTRQEQLNSARSSLNVDATAEMFAAYKELTQPQKQANQSQELRSQVAPAKSKSSSAAPTPDSSNRIWSAAEVTAALDPRKLRGMTPAEVERVMSDIDAASAEGRVKN